MVIAISTFKLEALVGAMLISLQGASFVLVLLTLGQLAARVGHQVFLRTACLIVAVSLAALGTARTVLVLWGRAISLGVGLGMLQIVTITWLSRLGARLGQGLIAGLTMFAGPAGGLVGSILGGVLGSHFGLQAVFIMLTPVFLMLLFGKLRTDD